MLGSKLSCRMAPLLLTRPSRSRIAHGVRRPLRSVPFAYTEKGQAAIASYHTRISLLSRIRSFDLSVPAHATFTKTTFISTERRSYSKSSEIGTPAAESADQVKAKAKSKLDHATPVMKQYWNLKDQHPEYLMLYRLGDFYECFFDDAVKASELLGIALTARGRHRGQEIPMCGIPHHALSTYLHRLAVCKFLQKVNQHGVLVAICEQVETAQEARKRQSAQKLIHREVVRLVTPGTLTEDIFLRPGRHNFIASVAGSIDKEMALAWMDLSTGELYTSFTSAKTLEGDLARCAPRELLLPDSLAHNEKSKSVVASSWRRAMGVYASSQPSGSAAGCRITLRPSIDFDSTRGQQHLSDIFSVRSSSTDKGEEDAAFALRAESSKEDLSKEEYGALSGILQYVWHTQKGKLPHIRYPQRVTAGDTMQIDASTRRSLELVHSVQGDKRGSLIDAIDRTITATGARLLSSHISRPLTDVDEINKRLDFVSYLIQNPSVNPKLRDILRSTRDQERCLQRLVLNRGSPRDLWAIENSNSHDSRYQDLLMEYAKALGGSGAAAELSQLIEEVVVDSPPASVTSPGGFVRAGYSEELDEWRRLHQIALHSEHHHSSRSSSAAEEGEEEEGGSPGQLLEDRQKKQTQSSQETPLSLTGLQRKYRELTGVPSLRIRSNNMLGFFLEIPSKKRDSLDDQIFFPCHTTKNTARFKTSELIALESRIYRAATEVARIEKEIFEQLRNKVLSYAQQVSDIAHALASIDVALSHAKLAMDHGLKRPSVNYSREIEIVDGRHLVVSLAHEKGDNGGSPFSQVSTTSPQEEENSDFNLDLSMSKTSRPFTPNSIHLSEDAISSILLTGPNMGGKSTFIRQNAHIVVLAQIGSFVPATRATIGIVDKLFSRVGSSDDLAGDRSTFLVEMQETAAILTQVLEHLVEGGVRTLFATHYRELSALSQKFSNLGLFTMDVITTEAESSSDYEEEEDEERSEESDRGEGIILTHKVVPGLAEQSYGLHVAEMAGCPSSVIERAKEILAALGEVRMLSPEQQDGEISRAEATERQKQQADVQRQMINEKQNASIVRTVAERMQEVNPNTLTPLEALKIVYEVKEMFDRVQR